MKPTIRVSEDGDGERIHELLRGMGFTIDGLDWASVANYWLVAETEGRIVGCVQFIAGKPVAWAELLAYDPALGHVMRAKVVKALVENVIGAAGMFGATAVMGSVPFELKSYKKIIKRRGGVMVASGNLFAKRLTSEE